MIYYLSGTGTSLSGTGAGQMEIWARRLDPVTKRPRGEACSVYSPSAQRGLSASNTFGPALGSPQLIFPMSESTGGGVG